MREHVFLRTMERVENTTTIRKKIEGGCEPRPGQPGRSDPKDEKWIPVLPVYERANSRNRRIIGAAPEVIEGPIEDA